MTLCSASYGIWLSENQIYIVAHRNVKSFFRAKNLTQRGGRPGLGGPGKPQPGGKFLVAKNPEGHRHRRHRDLPLLLLLPQPLQQEGGEGGAPAHSTGYEARSPICKVIIGEQPLNLNLKEQICHWKTRVQLEQGERSCATYAGRSYAAACASSVRQLVCLSVCLLVC